MAAGVGGAFAAAGAAIVAFGVDSVKATLDFAGQVDDLNDKLGIGAEETSRWAVAVKLGEGNVDALSAGMKKLSAGIVDGSDGLDKYGIATKDASGGSRDLTAVMLDIAGVFETLPNGAEKNKLAMDAFGKAGMDMIPFLDKGTAGITELLKASDKYGLTLSQDVLDAQDDVNKSLAEMGFAFQGVQVAIGSKLLPVIAEFVDGASEGLAEVARWAGDLTEAFVVMFDQVAPDLQSMMTGLGGIGPMLDTLGARIADFALGLDATFRVGGVLVNFFSQTFDGMTKLAVANVMMMITAVQTLGTAVGHGLAGEFDKIGPSLADGLDKMQTLGEIGVASLGQITNAAQGLGGALQGAALDAFNDTAALRNLGAAGVEAADSSDRALKKYQSSLTQAGDAITAHGVKVTEFAAKEAEINDKRIADNARVTEDLDRSYADAVRGMARKQEDWAAEEANLRKTTTAKINALQDEEAAKHKSTADRIAEINRILMTGQTADRMASLQGERAKLEAELAANDAAAVKKKAALDQELAEKLAAFDREKNRAIEDYNLSVTRAHDKAQYQINQTNDAAAAEIAAVDKKKAAEVAAVDAAKTAYDSLKTKIQEVTAATNEAANAAIAAANAFSSASIGTLPGRATGGPVTAGQPYMVGERGPEMFFPYTNGTIAPSLTSGASGGSAGGVTNVYVTVQGSVTTERDLHESIKDFLLRDIRRNGSQYA